MPMVFALIALFAQNPPAPAATDDFNFAKGLQDRRLFELAAEVYKGIAANASLPAEKRAEGELGLALLALAEAQSVASTKRQMELFDGSIVELRKFMTNYPKHPRTPEIMGQIAFVMRTKAKALSRGARNDPAKLQAALDCLKEAEELFQGKIASLESDIKKVRSEIEDAITDAQRKRLDDIDEDLVGSLYNYGLTLYGYIDVLKDIGSQKPLLLQKMDKAIEIIDDMTTRFNTAAYSFDASTYLARCYQQKAKMVSREEAEKLWKLSFDAMAMPRGLLDLKEAPNDPMIRELASEAVLVEMQIRIDYGDFVRGSDSVKAYTDAANLPDKCNLFKVYPTLPAEDVGRRVFLEKARAFYKAGDMKNAEKAVAQAVKETKDDSLYRVKAMEIQAGFKPDMPAADLIGSAKMQAANGRIFQALFMYREAAQKLEKTRGDVRMIEECWLAIGDLYSEFFRFHEAVRAFSVLEDARFSTEAREGAALKRQTALGKISTRTKDPAAKKDFEEWNAVMRSKYASLVGVADMVKAVWDAFDAKDYAGVIKAAAAIPPDKTAAVEETTFAAGWAYYIIAKNKAAEIDKQKIKELQDKARDEAAASYKQCVDVFEKHIALVNAAGGKDPQMQKRAVMSLFYLTLSAIHPSVNQPQRALAASENLLQRFPGGETKMIMQILQNRVDAHLMLVTEADTSHLTLAEQDIKLLEDVYGRAQAHGKIIAYALARLANELRRAGDALAKTDPAGGEGLKERAGSYFARAVDIQDIDENAPPDELIGYAEMFYDIAKRKGTVALFDKAYALYEKAYWGKRLSLAEKQQIKSRMADCAMQSGKGEKAVEILKELAGEDPKMNKLYVWKPLAKAYAEKAKRTADAAEKKKLLAESARIYGHFANLLYKSGVIDENYWEMLYEYLNALLLGGDYDKLYNELAYWMQKTPYWDDGRFNHPDGGKIDVKIDEIVRKYIALGSGKPLPPRKPKTEKPPDAPPPPPAPPPTPIPTPEPPKNP